MQCSVISYDLRNPGRNYQSLYNELENFNAKRILESQWVFRRNKTNAKGLRDYFKKFVDSNDRILITSIEDANWASSNLITKICDL